jgi:hypothetical protein
VGRCLETRDAINDRSVPSQLACVGRCLSHADSQTPLHPDEPGGESGRAFWFPNTLPPGQAGVVASRRHHRSLLRGPMFENQRRSNDFFVASQLACVGRCFDNGDSPTVTRFIEVALQ